MLELSEEQHQELSRQGDRPLPAVDPATQQVYYIISGHLYERVAGLLGDDKFDVRETYAAQEAALASVWDDPELDLYNNYDAHRQ